MEWEWVSTTGLAPVVTVYQCVKPRAGRYLLITYRYSDGKTWHDFAPGVRLITPRGKEFEGEENVKRELQKRRLPPFFD